jgi:two-component system NarL family response regulator
MGKIRLLLIEDNRLLREGIVAMFTGHEHIKIVAALGDRDKTSARIRDSKPGVVLLDLGLRSQNSLELVKMIKKDFSGIKVIVMDLVPLQADVIEYVQAGVSGFILKDASLADFVRTVRSVADGVKVLPPMLTSSLFSQIVERAISEPQGASSRLIESAVRMTKRERQVIELIAEGMTNKEIAHKLYLSTYTVKSHVHNILEKLALHTRVQIARHAHTSDDFSSARNILSLADD